MINGFTNKSEEIFWELRFNNSREWYSANKESFSNLVTSPMKELGKSVTDKMQELYPDREWNLHISRIYRDARRLYGRGPLKENLWFSLKNSMSDNEPSFYFEISPAGYSYGMGFYCTDSNTSEKFRQYVIKEITAFEKLANRINNDDRFILEGPLYKRAKGDYGPVVNEWYNRKYVSVCSNHDFGGDLYSDDLPDIITDAFEFLLPMHDFLYKACR